LASAGRLAEASGFNGVEFSRRKVATSFAILRTSSGVNATAGTVGGGAGPEGGGTSSDEGPGVSITLLKAEPTKGALLVRLEANVAR